MGEPKPGLDFVPPPAAFVEGAGKNPFAERLTNRLGGMGWVFETEEEDEAENQRPLLEELDIDPKDIMYKLRSVIMPYNVDREVLVRSPDFWGPLLVVMLYAIFVIKFSSVSWVLSIWFLGSGLIWLLLRVMGGDISYATTLGVIGYCVLPQFVLLVLRFTGVYLWPFRIAGIAWGALSSGTLLAASSPRPTMIYFPMLLLYTYFDAVATN